MGSKGHRKLVPRTVPKRTLWRYAVGSKTVNRVTVYQRGDSPNLYVEWYDDEGRHQESLRTATGKPITDKTLAMAVADRMAADQERKRNNEFGTMVFGSGGNHTLKELLERLHEDKARKWRDSTKKGQLNFKRFWLGKLGDEFRIRSWTGPQIERIVARAAKAEKWSPRTEGSYLRYIIDAAYYAQKKLKWLTEDQNLSAVEIPDPASEGVPYSEAEVAKLLPALRSVDPRAGLVGDAYWQAGRRLNATKTLRASQVRFDGAYAVLAYARGTDKAKKKGEAVLAGRAVGNLRKLMETPAVRASGLLCPEGELSSRRAKREVERSERFHKVWLPAAEQAAGIAHIAGRGFHGLKRAFATEAGDQDAAALQSGTTGQTLEAVYRTAKLEPKKKLAQHMAATVDSPRDPH